MPWHETSPRKPCLGIEAKLVGDDHELEGWRRRFDAGLMVGLSIGFRVGSG